MLQENYDYDYADAEQVIYAALAKAFAPRVSLTVSEWADKERRLSKKGSAEPGPWRTDRNPPLREPMDCLSSRSDIKDIVLMFPIQFGKTEIAVNALGYTMDHNPGPVMVCLPGEVSLHKWVNQKLNPMIEETEAVRATLTSVKSREAANTRTFKDYLGGQLYIEHAGSPSRLKSTSVRTLLVDELDEFAANFHGGDDPLDMLLGRTSAFPATFKRLFISTPGIKGISRTEQLYEKSDQRKFYLPCPHCGFEQHLEWAGLQWGAEGHHVRYVCKDCGTLGTEIEWKNQILPGRWIAGNPTAKMRGYQINCLYYQIGLGPRWEELVGFWLEAQNDPARLKTFVNDRLAETWEDPVMRAVKMNIVSDRAEPYKVRIAQLGVCAITAGVDTQDNRLAVHIVGWGKGMTAWTLDYIELMGDPADDTVWVSLTELLNKPIEHVNGGSLPVLATLIDAGGHRTEAVKNYVRSRMIKRPMCGFGAVSNNAPVLSRAKAQDVNWRGNLDRRGVHIHHVGTVAIKHVFYGRLSTDGDKEREKRLLHFSEDFEPQFFAGLTSETYDPRKNRFTNKRGARNEPLDCFDRETEVLTNYGWKRFCDLKDNNLLATVDLDVDEIEYQRPTALIKRHYCGKMIHLKGTRLDILVTPKHRMVTLKAKQQTEDGKRLWNFDVKPKITLAKDLTKHHCIKIKSNWTGQPDSPVHIPASISKQGRVIQRAVDVDVKIMASFLGWWVSEGSTKEIKSKTQGNWRRIVQIAQTKPKEREIIRELLIKTPWKWREEKDRFICSSKQLHDYVIQYGKYQCQRIVPDWIKQSNKDVISCFVDAAIAGDGWTQKKKQHHRASRVYSTTSKLLADDFQELFIKLGHAATMRIVCPESWNIQGRSGTNVKKQYHVYERLASRAYLEGGTRHGREFIGKYVDYDDMVYCASVPNGTLIVRRSGKTFIAGNCWVYAYAAAHHPELRMHLYTHKKWDELQAKTVISAPDVIHGTSVVVKPKKPKRNSALL